MNSYKINFSENEPGANANWNAPVWQKAETAELKFIRPESSSHNPIVKARLLYSLDGISGVFHVEDKYVICKSSRPMDPVWRDSCVEFFVKPSTGKGYFNFEFNCIGVLHASYIVDPERNENGFKDFIKFTLEDCKSVIAVSSLNGLIKEEIAGSVNWALGFFIPFSLLEKYVGGIEPVKEGWSCNFNNMRR